MSTRGRYPRILLLALCPILFVESACDNPGPRELAAPVFDARAPFAELSASGASAPASANQDGQKSGASDFEKAIAESMGEGGGGDAKKDSPTADESIQTQKVALPGGLGSSIPLDFDTWQWTSDKDLTVITHRAPGATSPDAMIYAERFGALMRSFPSKEMARFQTFADPGFAPLSDTIASAPKAAAEQVAQQVAQQASNSGLDPDKLRELGVDPAQLTGQQANNPQKAAPTLHYRSTRDTFSGWKWFGQNAADVTLRLGRTEGRWSAPEVGGQDESARQTSSAWMLLGSANTGGGRGTHIAIICKQAPRCPVAAELSDFLAQIEQN